MNATREHKPVTIVLPYVTPILAALAIVFSVSVLIGWATNSLLIARINARFIPMAPATALCFVLLGAVLLLRQGQPDHRILRRLWQALAGIVLLFNIAILTLTAFLSFFDLSLDIEQWLAAASLSGQGYVTGIMSPVAAALFTLLSSAVLLSLPAREGNHWRDRLAQVAAAIVFLLAGILITGYWYGAPLLYGGTITPMALTTALAFLLLGGGFLFEGANAFFSHWMLSASIFSRFTRRVIPGAAGIVLILGWLHATVIEESHPTYHALFVALSALISTGFVALLTVVTARQTQNAVTQAGQELRESEQRYQTLAEVSPVGIFRTDAQGLTIYVNRRWCEISGMSAGEAPGNGWLKAVHPDDREKLTGNWQDAVQEQSVSRADYRFLKPDGSVTWVIGQAVPEKDESGRILSYIGTITDITEHKQAEEQVRQYVKRLSRLNYIARAASATLNLDELLEIIYREVMAAVPAEAFFIALYDQTKNELDFRIREDKGKREPPERRPLGAALTARVVTSKRPLLIRDYEREKDRLPPIKLWGTQQAPASWLGVPMLIGDRIVGVISVQAYHPDAFGDAEQELLATIGNTAAVAIENARLYAAEQHRAARLTDILRLSMELTVLREEKTVLSTLVARAAAIMESSTCTVMFIDAGTNEAVLAAQVGLPENTPSNLRVPLALPLIHQMLETGEPMILKDINHDAPQMRTVLVRPDVRAFFAYPMVRAGDVIGIITFSKLTPHSPSMEEITACRLLAERAAVALENARLYETVRQELTERKRAEEEVRAALEQKETLLREVHHRVKNNLQAIISLMDMHAAQIEDAGIRQFLKELEEQARTMSLVYEQLYQSEDLAQVDMALYLQKLASNVLEAFAGGRAIKLDLKLAPVSLDVAQAMPCGLIVNELLTNSLKHAFPPRFRGKPALHIALKKHGKSYRLTVGDNGIGLPAGYDWQKGKSLGLRLVHLWAAHQLGGALGRLKGPGTNYSLRFGV
ncbi:MAG: signal transduction histidine kinase [Anaerolineaceae bacterium]|nr:MAG: signal transduction histidine kinase [Anaerolineaceae bacterium]